MLFSGLGEGAIGALDGGEQLDLALAGANSMGREPAAVEAFMVALTDPVAKAEGSVAAAKIVIGEDLGTGLRLLATEESLEKRLEQLKASLDHRRDVAGKRPLSAAEEEMMRGVLTIWSVAPDRIEELAGLVTEKGGGR